MGKKFIEVDGKKVYLDEAQIQDEAVKTLSPEEKELEETVKKISAGVEAELGLKDFKAKLAVAEEMEKQKASAKRKSKIVTLQDLSEKSIDQLTTRQALAVFFKAAIDNDKVKLKALAEGVAADGGNLFPDEFRSELIRDVAEIAIMRSLVRVVPMTKDVMKIPTLTAKPLVYWTTENAAKTTTTADFGQATLTVYKMAAIIYASDELIEDSNEIDVVDLIINLFAERIADEEDKVISQGNGTTQPTGLTQATVGSVACSGTFDFDDLISLEYTLPAKYSKNAKFLASRNNIKIMRQLKDSNNRYLWMDAVAPGQPATFHGYPVYENDYIGENEIYFGDYQKGYWLGDRRRMTIKITQDSETAFTKDQTAIRVVERIAGNVILAEAIKKLTGI